MNVLDLFSKLTASGVRLFIENDNLKINAPKGKLTPDLLAELKENKEALLQFLKRHSQPQSQDVEIPQAGIKEYYALSSAQKRLYILDRLEPGSTIYNISELLILEGDVEKAKLEQIFKTLIDRHESLRTSFLMINDEPVQKIHSTVDFKFEHYDLSGLNVTPDSPEVRKITDEFVRPFELSQSHLFRVGLITLPVKQNVLMVDMHHIISDGFSSGILIREFIALYAGQMLPELRIQYKDFSEWQRSEGERERIKKQEDFWLEQFSGEVPVLYLPTDYERPELQAFSGDSVEVIVDAEKTSSLKKMIKDAEATVFMGLISICYILLSKLSKQEDIVIGTPTAGRKYSDLEPIIGMFVNTLAIRNYPEGHKTAFDFLKEVKKTTLAVFDNQEFQFEELVEKLDLVRDTGRNPLFDVVFAYQNLDIPTVEIPGLKMKDYEKKIDTTKFDLHFVGAELEGKFFINIQYCTRLFKKETAQRFTSYFAHIAACIAENPEIKIEDIDILPEDEKQALLVEFNKTDKHYPSHVTINELFEAQAEKTPLKKAIINAEGNELSYIEANDKANRLAWTLKQKGIKTGDIIGILATRSVESVIAALAVLKAGGAFLFIEPDYPDSRKTFIIQDCCLDILLTQQNLIAENTPVFEWLSEESVVLIDDESGYSSRKENLPINHSPADPAYILYTSGSTGQPKGVVVRHFNVVNYITWAITQYVKDETISMPLFTSLSFDLTVTSVFTPLLSGNTIIVYGGSSRDSLIDKILEENRVDIVKLTPAHLRLIVNTWKEKNPLMMKKMDSKIRRFIVGGEALETKLASEITDMMKNPIEIFNEYGPTEATVGCMIYKFDKQKDTRYSVPVGIPAANVQIFLLDTHFRPVPRGVPGEMFIAGDGIAAGYLNRPLMTAERFVSMPQAARDLFEKRSLDPQKLLIKGNESINKSFSGVQGGTLRCSDNSERKNNILNDTFGHIIPDQMAPHAVGQKSPLATHTLYRTGDLACFLDDGNIDFLGRVDDQVKIRGFRVELGEVENKIRAFKKKEPVRVSYTEDAFADPEGVKRCTKCLIPSNYPGAAFDEEGVCSICREYEKFKEEVDRYFKTGEYFTQLVDQVKKQKRGEYDCLLLFSGGKDSTFVLYRLIDMGLKVLTFTFDNGYISDAAFANIRRTTEALGVKNIVGTAKTMNHVFVESLNTNHNVCHGCWNALNTIGVKVAHDNGIDLVISGLSRGQIFEMRLEGLFERGIYGEEEIEQNLVLFRKAFFSKNNRYARLLDIELAEEVVDQVHFVDYFRYYNDSVNEIREYLHRKGWVQPADTGFCSTNCIINDVGIYVFQKERNYHFYAAPLSWDCRLGVITRERGLNEITFQGQLETVERILKEVGYYHPPVKDVVVLDNVNSSGEKFLSAYIVSNEELTVPQIREFLSAQLPEYMIPSQFILVDKIPLTSNGKIDRKALTRIGKQLDSGRAYVPPGNETEEKLAKIWAEILEIEKVSVDANFFELGGNSLNLIKMNARINQAFNKDIPVASLFRLSTVQALAAHILEDEVKLQVTDEILDQSVNTADETLSLLGAF